MQQPVQRERVIVGNWKMYKTIDQAFAFIDQIAPLVTSDHCRVMLAVPFTAIHAVADKAKGTKLIIGAQNMNDASEGAFTGEVSASMLKDAGASFVLLGHSERRTYFSENNEFINRKLKRALSSGLQPILCIGETRQEHDQQQTQDVLRRQLSECLAGITTDSKGSLIVSYEPVWAIGTGVAAVPSVAEEAQQFCRQLLQELFGEESAMKIPILYGGSVDAGNAQNYLAEKNIDGLLIGSASLVTESFAKIIELGQNI